MNEEDAAIRRAHVNQLVLTMLVTFQLVLVSFDLDLPMVISCDLNDEAHDVHHPISVSESQNQNPCC